MHDWESYEDFLAMFTHPDRPPQRFTASIVRLQDQATVGRISLAPAYLEPDLGIWIYEPFRFKGYGTEVVRLAVDYIFRALELDYIIAGIYEFNRRVSIYSPKSALRGSPNSTRPKRAFLAKARSCNLGFDLNRRI